MPPRTNIHTQDLIIVALGILRLVVPKLDFPLSLHVPFYNTAVLGGREKLTLVLIKFQTCDTFLVTLIEK